MSEERAAEIAEKIATDYLAIRTEVLYRIIMKERIEDSQIRSFTKGAQAGAAIILAGVINGDIDLTEIKAEMQKESERKE